MRGTDLISSVGGPCSSVLLLLAWRGLCKSTSSAGGVGGSSLSLRYTIGPACTTPSSSADALPVLLSGVLVLLYGAADWARRFHSGREKKCVVVVWVVVVTTWVVVVVISAEYNDGSCPLCAYGGGGGVAGREGAVGLPDLEGDPLLPRWNIPTMPRAPGVEMAPGRR